MRRIFVLSLCLSGFAFAKLSARAEGRAEPEARQSDERTVAQTGDGLDAEGRPR